MRGQPVATIVTVDILIILTLARSGEDGRPQRDKAGALGTFMRRRFAIKPEGGKAQKRNRAIDEIEHHIGRAERLAEVEILPARLAPIDAAGADAVTRLHDARLNLLLGAGEVFRTGSLKPENRLFVIAHGEDGAQLIPARAFAAEEIIDQREHDVPLALIGILRLVDQDVVEMPIKLVADPVCRRRIAKQVGGLADQVGKIEQPFAGLARLPPERERPPDFERGGDDFGGGNQRAPDFDFLNRGGNRLLIVDEIKVSLARLLKGEARHAIRPEQRAPKPRSGGNPVRPVQLQPFAHEAKALGRRRRAPRFKRGNHRQQMVVRKNIRMQRFVRPIRASISGHPQGLSHPRIHRG